MPRQGGLALPLAASTSPVPATGALTIGRAAGAITSGLLLAAAFPPLDRGWLGWVALAPLLWALRSVTVRAAFWLGLFAGGVWFALLLAWAPRFGLPAWVLLTAILALYVGAFTSGLRWLAGRFPRQELALAPLVWVAVEIARSVGPLGFPWGVLGATQYRSLPVLQLASVGGVHLVSLALVTGNALLLGLLTKGLRRAAVLLAAAALLAAALAFGAWRAQQPLAPGLAVAALQPNIDPLAKGAAATWAQQVETMRALTLDATRGGADLIVFPETAIPLDLLGTHGLAREVGAWAGDRTLVASSLETGGGVGPVRNTAVVLQGPTVMAVYHKRRLVPFGEAGIAPGRVRGVAETRLGSLGLAICYESTFPHPAREAARRGADVLVVLTNDGWFGASAGPAQHAAFSVLRAVETGRTLVRAANTGPSMVVDPHGQVQAALPTGGRGVAAAVGSPPLDTLYVRGGWLFDVLLPATALALVLGAAGPALTDWRGDPAFARLLRVLLFPGLVVGLAPLAALPPAAARWGIPAALLLAVRLGAGGWAHLALRPRRALPGTLLGLLLVGGLGAAMTSAYARYGLSLPLAPPEGGWVWGVAVILLEALAWEAWVHGALFGAALAWRGPLVAVLLSAAPALAVFWAAPSELLLWSVLTGALLGAIRLLTGDALGLVLPRAAGMVLLGGLAALRF